MIRNITISIAVVTILAGCSGHSLQDYTDSYFAGDKKTEQQSSSVSVKKSVSANKDLQTKIDEWLGSSSNDRIYVSEKKSSAPAVSSYDARVNTSAIMSGSDVEESSGGYLQDKVNSYNARVNTSAVMSASEVATDEEKGWMQRNLDEWFKSEWIPFLNDEDNKAIFDRDPNKEFTLQEFVDKWSLYNKQKAEREKGLPPKPSLSRDMQSMPVIGDSE
jgi:hypothetical protein